MGFTQFSNTWKRSAASLLPPRLILLVETIHTHSTSYRLTNAQLAQELGCTERYIKKLLAKAKEFRLLDIAGQPRPFRGYTRSIMLTNDCLNWIKKGTVPQHLKIGVKKFNSEELLSPTRGELQDLSIEEKKQENKESKQSLPKKVALLAPSCDEESFELPPAEPEKPERTEMACNALSRKQTSNHTQNERKSRGEPVKGLPEALANKVAQYQADDLWQAIESAGLNLKSSVALYELALEKNVTPAEFKTILAKALARQPYNLGGLLNTLLKEDVYGMRARDLRSEKEVFFDRRKAHAQQAIAFCDALGLVRYTAGERNEYLYIPKFSKYIPLDIPNEELVIELQGLKQQHG